MGLAYRVITSSVSGFIKTTYRNLVRVMLNKTITGGGGTEWERLQKGLLPTMAVSRNDKFQKCMTRVAGELGLDVTPMCMWYLMCKTLPSEMLTAQEIHCRDELKGAFQASTKDLNVYQTETSLYYTCLITLEDTSKTGGWCIKMHGEDGCHPNCVLSMEGYGGLMQHPDRRMCPICYTRLSEDMFELVPPKADAPDTDLLPAHTGEPFFHRSARPTANGAAPSSRQHPSAVPQPTGTAKLVLLKGPVGAGKTTLSEKIRRQVQERGGYCIIEGFDMYSVRNIQYRDALKIIQRHLAAALADKSGDKVVVIDTCGERMQGSIFGVDFSGWERITINVNYDSRDLEGYMAWSLRNVLNRPSYAQDTPFYLTPVNAGVDVCVEVHQKKCKALFGKQLAIKKGTKEEVLAQISAQADRYQQILGSFEHQIDSI